MILSRAWHDTPADGMVCSWFLPFHYFILDFILGFLHFSLELHSNQRHFIRIKGERKIGGGGREKHFLSNPSRSFRFGSTRDCCGWIGRRRTARPTNSLQEWRKERARMAAHQRRGEGRGREKISPSMGAHLLPSRLQ